MITSNSVKLVKSAWMPGKAKTHTAFHWHHSTSLETHYTAPVSSSSPLSQQCEGPGCSDPSPFQLVFHDGLISQEKPLKMGTRIPCCQYPLTGTQHACKVRKTGVTEHQRAQHPFLGVPSAFEDQALGYSLREDMNRPFSLPSLETLAALLEHKHNQV